MPLSIMSFTFLSFGIRSFGSHGRYIIEVDTASAA